MNKKNKDEIVFASYGVPFSSDPLDFDFYVHHYAFSSVYARLVSIEKSGEITPQLAKSWENLENFKVWRFTLKDNLSYSNGDLIKYEDILLNFKRLLFLSQKNNSKSGVLEFIEGCEFVNGINSDCSGIKLNDNILELRFIKPMGNLLSLISFGLYGLAHPKLYNHINGEWENKKEVISSSNYEMVNWNDNEFKLGLRKDSYLKNEQDVVQNIKIISLEVIKESKDLDNVDLLFADKSSLMVDDRFKFIGSSVNLKIGYLKVNSWNNATSELSKVEVRKWLRKKFYDSLEKNGVIITNSFLPKNLKGILEISPESEVEKPKLKSLNINLPEINISGKLKENSNKKSIPEIFKDAYASLEGDGVSINYSNSNNNFDMQILGTGIESIDYLDTVRFMFLSKEGIKLPDTNGKIFNELKKDVPDVNFINNEIWNQAVIWPIRHYSGGYWYKYESDLDVSMINVDSPSIDFQFVRWKK